jgi:hypothetical protein
MEMTEIKSVDQIERFSREVSSATSEAFRDKGFNLVAFFNGHEKAIQIGQIQLIKDDYERKHALAKIHSEIQIGLAKQLADTVLTSLIVTGQQEIAATITDSLSELNKKISSANQEFGESTDKDLERLSKISDSRVRDRLEQQILDKFSMNLDFTGDIMKNFIALVKGIKGRLGSI